MKRNNSKRNIANTLNRLALKHNVISGVSLFEQEHEKTIRKAYYNLSRALKGADNGLMYTENVLYTKWVKQAGLPPLTRNQYEFARFILEKENTKFVSVIGDNKTIFLSIHKFLKGW